MLGQANVSQTSTYLHSEEMGLRASMQRFAAARGKLVATSQSTEHPPLDEGKDGKELLH
jgi:hypothetical protein